MKRKMTWTAAIVAAAVVALVGLPSVAGSAGAQSGVRGVTDKEIKIGGLSATPYFGPNVGKAAQARFDEANKKGEIPGGRKINFIGTAEDKLSPDAALSELRRLVDQERVFAIVPSMSAVLNAADYLNQQKVPLIGWGVSPTQCVATNKYAFGFNGCLVSASFSNYAPDNPGPAIADTVKRQGQNPRQMTAAVMGENFDSSKAGTTGVANSVRNAGFDLVYAESTMPAAPTVVTDFSPYVQALMTANKGQPPDVIYFAFASANLFGLERALKQAGYKGLMIDGAFDVLVTAAKAGTMAASTFAGPDDGVPAMDKIVATLHAASLDSIGQGELAGYFSADMLIQILQKVGKNLTPERFQKVAAHFKYEIPGVVGPSYYPAGFKVGTPCASIHASDGKKWTIASPYKCYGTAQKKNGDAYVQVKYPQDVK